MPNGITLGALNLDASINSVTAELVYTGDDNNDASALLEFSFDGGSTWRKAAGPPSRVTASFGVTQNMRRLAFLNNGTTPIPDGGVRGFYGKVHFAEPGSLVQVRVTVTDADGVAGTNPVTGSITTRLDAVTPPDQITATTTLHVNSATGSDASGTGASGSPYKSLARAVAVANALGGSSSVLILLHRNGSTTTYYRPGGSLTRTNTTVKGEYLPVDASRELINDGGRIVIEPGPATTGDSVAPYVIGKAGAADADITRASTGWTQVTIPGRDQADAPTGRSYPVWKYSGLGVNSPAQWYYGATRAEQPKRLGLWVETTQRQTVTITGNPAGGTWRLTHGGNQTSALAHNATAAEVQAALRLLAGLGSVSVSRSPSGSTMAATVTYTVTGNSARTAGSSGDGTAAGVYHGASFTFTNSLTGGSSPAITHTNINSNAVMPISNVAQWAETLWTVSQTDREGFHYGGYCDALGTIYVRVYDPTKSTYADAEDLTNRGADPRDFYWKFDTVSSSEAGILLNGDDQRVCGLEFHGCGTAVRIQTAADRAIIDRNYIQTGTYGIRCSSTPPATYGRDAIIERNRIVATNLWANPLNPGVIPWVAVKSDSRNLTGSETLAISFSAGPKHSIIRHNTVRGVFDFLNMNPTNYSTTTSGYDRYANYGLDVHDNDVRECPDDFADAGKQGTNISFWANVMSGLPVGLSTGPGFGGIIYFLRNLLWRMSAVGVPQSPIGGLGPEGAKAFKYSQDSDPAQLVIVAHNTVYGDELGEDIGAPITSGRDGVSGGGEMTAGGNIIAECYWHRNNIYIGTRHAYHVARIAHFLDEDYNLFVTTNDVTGDQVRGLEIGAGTGAGTHQTIAAWRAAVSMGAHSNVIDGEDVPVRYLGGRAFLAALFADPTVVTGVIPHVTSGLRGAGTPVGNVSDVEYASGDVKLYHRNGSTPDLGYAEYLGEPVPEPSPTLTRTMRTRTLRTRTLRTRTLRTRTAV